VAINYNTKKEKEEFMGKVYRIFFETVEDKFGVLLFVSGDILD
jgi:hypothetical protein